MSEKEYENMPKDIERMMLKINDEIKPCPFCGMQPNTQESGTFLHCFNKMCVLYARAFDYVGWNTRPTSTDPTMQPLNEEALDNLISDVIETSDIWYRGEVDCTKLRIVLVKSIKSKFHAPVRVPSVEELSNVTVGLVEEFFPKGKCQERGNALVLHAKMLIAIVDHLSTQGGKG